MKNKKKSWKLLITKSLIKRQTILNTKCGTHYSFKLCVRFYKGHCVPKQPIRAIKKLKYSRICIKCFVLFVFSKRDRLWKLVKAKQIKMCMHNFIKIFQMVEELNFTFFRIWTSAKPRPISNVIWLSHGLHYVNINVLQNFITIVNSVQEIGPFSLFQNLELGKTSTNEKCHFAISWPRSCQYQCLRKSL